jgi:8-oxo-dGTP diphosphatase
MEKQIEVRVSCVPFGYFESKLYVLLSRDLAGVIQNKWSFCEGDIGESESCESAVQRCLAGNLVLQNSVYTEQFKTYSCTWSAESQIVLVVYFCLLDISQEIIAIRAHSQWFGYDSLPEIESERMLILKECRQELCKRITCQPISIRLLPITFTIRTLRNIYQMFCDADLDVSNFKKRILSLGLLKPENEKAQSRLGRRAHLFSFDYSKIGKNKLDLGKAIMKPLERSYVSA